MRLKLEQEKRIRDIIGSCDYEDKETSITFKCLDKMVNVWRQLAIKFSKKFLLLFRPYKRKAKREAKIIFLEN